MIARVPCQLCAGSGRCERFESKRPGGVWAREAGADDLPQHAVAELYAEALRRAPHLFRWAECECPRCNGAGAYDVEGVPCRIF